MKKPIHLFMVSQDRTYCGISAQWYRLNGKTDRLTVDSRIHTCDECDRALGLYLLSNV